SFTPASLGDGLHNLTAQATDAAGNQGSPSANLAVTIDTAAPVAPTLALDPASDLGPSNSDLKTSDNTPTLTGTTEANASVAIYDGLTLLGQTTANGSGAWTFTPVSLGDGDHTFTALASDLAGNSGPASASLTVTIDTAAPAAPAIALDPTSDTGASGDGKTADNTPTLSGTAEANASIAIFDGANQIGQTTADGSGNWSITAGTLGDGLHNLTARATDISGNQGQASANLAVTIDTAAPAAPAIALDPASDTGSAGDGKTADNTPTLTGTAEANAAITVFDGANQIGQTTADGSGNWTYTTGILGDGVHNFTATAADAADNLGPASANLAVTIDTAAPAAPAIALDPASDTGTSNSDLLTKDTTPTLTGTAESGASVAVYDGAGLLGQTTADGSGNWTYTTGILGDGLHNLTATATDVAGNLGPASANLAVTIDTAAPAVPTIALDPASDTGTAGDGITADNTPTFNGTAVAGSSIAIYDGANLLGQTTANGAGNWSFTTGSLGDGGHNFTAKAGDGAGNQSNASGNLALTINATTPQIVETKVIASSDDAEQAVSNGAVNLTSSDLELINEADGVGNQIVGVRFANLAVPVGAVITKAYVQFFADESQSEATNLTIKAQASANAGTFTAATNNVSGRPETASSVTWSPVAWATADLNGVAQKTPDISSLVQEVVSLAGWTQNNPIALIFSGTGHRTAVSFDAYSGTQAAVLHVEYIMGGSNTAPVAAADSVTINEDTPTTIAVLGNDSDANGDPLTVTGTSLPGHGSVAINVDGTLTYTPTANYNGADSFTYTISDGHGGTSTATVSVGITPVNDVPVANADAAFILSGSQATVAVLANDTDADGDTLQVTGIGAAAHGTAVLNGNGTVTYTPNAGYIGADSVSYDISDGHGGTATGTMTVTTLDPTQSLAVEARVSTSSDDAEQALTNVTAKNVTVGQVFLDSTDLDLINDVEYVGSQAVGIRFHDLGIPVGAVITKAWLQFTVSERTIIDPMALTIHAQDSVNAPTFTTAANNITSRPTTASAATWSPDPWLVDGDHGAAQQSVDISALVQEVVSKTGWSPNNALAFIITGAGDRSAMTFDQSATSAPVLHVEFKLGTANVAPTAAADSAITAEDTAVAINVLGNDSDPDSNPLIAAAAGPAAHGNVVINADNTITYTPYANYNGADSFKYTMSDGNGGLSIATVSVTVTPVNDAPQAINDLAVTAADTAVTVKVLANDLDVDGDPLTVNAGAGLHGTTAVQADGSVLYTPDAGFTGIDTFNYTVLDGNGGSDTATATVHVGTGFGTTTFAALGDYGVNNGHELAVANLIKAKNPDFIVTLGDNTYGAANTPDLAVGQYYSDYIGNYQGIYGPGSVDNRFFPALSNHDWTDSGIKAYQDFFTIPESSSHNSLYYDFVQGPVQFFVMDTDPRGPDGFAPGSAQYQWLQNGLANSVTPWQIVVVPSPPYSSGSTYGSNPATQLPFEQWGADAVLSGDDHDYERIMKDANNDGVQLPYFVNGLGGASNLPMNAPVAGSVVQYNTDYGAMLVTASDTQLHFEFWSIANGGSLIDSYTINMPLA
ncbi:MAG: tandem-95 repeat protein, partial [Rhizobiales bacterium]|nr:tandem-95 repeat protein [Hyphomicrobiales bacterium]